MTTLNMLDCSPSMTKAILLKVFAMPADVRPTVMLHGEPGVGKSSIVRQAHEEFFKGQPEAKFADVRLAAHESSDLKGLPAFNDEKTKVHWAKPDFLPETGNGTLLFDEITSARRDVMAATYQIVLDHAIDDLKISDGYRIVAAGNDTADGAIANAMGTALADRMLHIKVVSSPGDFIRYHEVRDLHPAVLALIKQMPQLLSANKRRIEEDLMVSGTPRSWERVSDLLKTFAPGHHLTDDELRIAEVVASGCVGQEGATHLRMTLTDIGECAEPEKLLKTPLNAIEPLLPKTLRSAVALTYAFGYVCDTPEKIRKGCAVMAALGQYANSGKMKKVDGAIAAMTGNEVSALGIERLLLKAEQLNCVEQVTSEPGEGLAELLAYIESAATRYSSLIRNAA